ncbi:UNVERIFIED_CONTAM: hypothetical protein HDU68_002238 [Siphonaria sp. JEL0065]|nr:hypothetical protein HDU68_002238 [Siphonaria sp. JEL0065]
MTNDPESPPLFSSPPASPCQLRTTTSTKQTPAFGQLLAKYRFSDKTKFHTHTFFAQPISKLTNQRNGATGLNSITEKTQSRFKFFVDLDLKTNAFEEGTIHLDNVPQLMTDILCTFTQVLKLMFPDSQTIGCITAFRMMYKCHAYFPSVVCEVAQAKAVCLTVTKRLTRKYPWIATMKVIDDSVYTSGLRILGSHKGAMNRTVSNIINFLDPMFPTATTTNIIIGGSSPVGGTSVVGVAGGGVGVGGGVAGGAGGVGGGAGGVAGSTSSVVASTSLKRASSPSHRDYQQPRRKLIFNLDNDIEQVRGVGVGVGVGIQGPLDPAEPLNETETEFVQRYIANLTLNNAEVPSTFPHPNLNLTIHRAKRYPTD